MKATAYVFYADGCAKVGYTTDMEGRLFQLLWGQRPAYVPIANGAGELVARVDYDDVAEAILTETACKDALAPHAISKNRRGGRCEWFAVSRSHALLVFDEACRGETIRLPLTQQQMRKLQTMKRVHGYPSVHAVAIEALRQFVTR